MYTKELNEKIAFIQSLNFNDIINKMASPYYELPRWKKEEARYCAKLYKCFMILMLRYPDLQIIPSKEIDEFWHNHILDTRRYIQDCDFIFGRYCHHDPAYNLSESLLNEFNKPFEKTVELFKKEFNIDL